MLIFDDSCEKICHSDAFIDIAAAGRYPGLSTIFIRHNLFPQSKLGRDVELQDMHIVLCKSLRDVMQVSTLSGQLGLGSGLSNRYGDATSVPYGQLLIDFLPRVDDQLRYCANTGSIPSNFYNPDRLKESRFLDDVHKRYLYSPNVPISFHKCKCLFLQSCPKEFIGFLCEFIVNLLKGNLQSKKIHHVTKFQNEVRLLPLKRIAWWQRLASIRKIVTTVKSIYSSRH